MAKRGMKPTPGAFKCSKCDRAFGMAMHLARHMSTMHGVKSKSAMKKMKPRGKVGRPRKMAKPAGGSSAVRRRGRPSAIATRFGLHNLRLEDLVKLRDEAGALARARLGEIQRGL